MRALIPLLLFVAAPLAAATAPRESWGKAGVSFADYRADSIACAQGAYFADLSGTEQAHEFVAASRRIDNLMDSGSISASDPMTGTGLDPRLNQVAQEVHALNPEQKIKELGTLQYGLLDRCLAKRGYVRFRLTEGQRKHLEHLKKGADARHAYLHGLASDPKILSAQAVGAAG